jgi:UDP-N-acetylmuramoylalanine--D-glutamate ligase
MLPGDLLGSWAGASVTVAGAGVTGTSVSEVLTARGAAVTIVTDPASLPPDSDLVITSPGWAPQHPLFAQAAAAGVPVWGDVELAWRLRPVGAAPWLVVTGTNGKTTTTEMLHAILTAEGFSCAVAGNIGPPILDAVLAGHDVLAVELSSFQLHWAPSVVPAAAVILNVADDHADWHGSLEAYSQAKAQVWRSPDTVAVAVAEDEDSMRLLASAAGRRVVVRLETPGPGELGVHVDHEHALLVDRCFAEGAPAQAEAVLDLADAPHLAARTLLTDAVAATALARAHGVSAAAVAGALEHYRPGHHRNEVVVVVDGVTYVDDSKATNPHAAIASLASHDRIVWIAGGRNKGMAFDDLVIAAASTVHAVVLLGECAEEIAEALSRHAPQIPLTRVATMDDGVRAAARLAQPGDTVLLAPAVASMDMFTDYRHRGQVFAAAVHQLETPSP